MKNEVRGRGIPSSRVKTISRPRKNHLRDDLREMISKITPGYFIFPKKIRNCFQTRYIFRGNVVTHSVHARALDLRIVLATVLL